MTTIAHTSGFTFSSTTIDALARATKTRFTKEIRGAGLRSAYTYFACGYKFTPKQFGEFMIAQANDWMIENGLVDLDVIRNHRRGGYYVFEVIE